MTTREYPPDDLEAFRRMKAASAGLGGPPGAQTMDEVLFQATFFLGAHPAHRF